MEFYWEERENLTKLEGNIEHFGGVKWVGWRGEGHWWPVTVHGGGCATTTNGGDRERGGGR